MPSYLTIRYFVLAILLVAEFTFGVGCQSSSDPVTKGGPALDISTAATTIAEGIGAVQKTSSIGNKGPVFVFEEFHTSRVGQLQIAAMLVRLHDKYGLKKVGLEGKVQSPQALETAWYQTAGGGNAKTEREDLAVRLLAEGEISSAELLAMQFPDVKVYGTESAELYAQTLDVKGNPEVDYLLAIAEKSLTPSQMQEVARLLKAKNTDKAFDVMLKADPWVKAHYEAIASGKATSSEQEIATIKEMQAKAVSVGAQIEPQAKADIDRVIKFYETASLRSDAMVDKTIELLADQNGSPIAMIIGAAHSDKVAELLEKQKVAFALIQPADLNPTFGSLTTEQYERKANGQWARTGRGTLGHVLNAQRKPPPVVERVEGHGYASMNLAGMLIAKAARAHRRVPDDIWSDISSLPGIRVDKASFEQDGYDVIFRAWLRQDDGREKEVWTRVGTIEHPTGPAGGSLEQKLISAANQFKPGAGGGGRKGGDGKNGGPRDGAEPAGDLPRGSRRAENEGPGDAKRGDLVISRTSRETLAIFGSSREEVKGANKISI